MAVLGILGGPVGLAAFLRFAVLVVVGVGPARRVGYGESAGSCAISCAGCLGLIIVLAVAIAALAAIVAAGASGSAGAS